MIAAFVIIVTLLFTLLGYIFLLLINKFKKNKKLNKLNIENLEINYQLNLLKSQLQIQEQTFQNISREIHDNIGQKLTLAKLKINTINTNQVVDLNDTLMVISKLITDSLNDLRDISRSLSSEVILNNGLIKALENEINQLNKLFNYNFKMKLTGEVLYMSAETELTVFRIIQEALTNSIKHAEATSVFLDLHFINNELLISIEDNGKGFEISVIKDLNGLNNLKSRTQSLNGQIEINSEPLIGTTIKIKIPIYESKN
jgi:signal transduction histidine kinase